MILDYLRRGAVAGLVAGLGYGVFLAVVANPLVAYLESIALESGGHPPGGDGSIHVVAETTTVAASVGGGVLWGGLLGAAFGVAFFFFEPVFPDAEPAAVYVLAAGGFLTVSVTPWLVLPPTVPGAEHTVPTGVRLPIYGGLMVLGAGLFVGTVIAYRVGASRLGSGIAAVASIGAMVAALVLVATVTPTITAATAIPHDLAVTFTGLVVLSQAGLWGTIATAYGWFHLRSVRGWGGAMRDDDQRSTTGYAE